MKIFFLLITIFFLQTSFAEDLKPYTVFLKEGTVLTRISDQKDFRIEHGVYAKVLETSPTRRDHFLVYDKTGKATYETTALGIVEIEKDIKILPEMDAEITYPAPSIYKSNNKNAFFDTQFNIHLDSLQTSPFNQIYNQDLANAVGNRFELRTLYNSEIPVNFGFAANYETASWSSENDEMKLSILSVGPYLQHYVYEEDTFAVSLILGGEYAPIYRTSSGPEVDHYTAMIFDLGAEVLWDTSLGKWSFGAHYRRHDLTLSSTSRSGVTAVPEDITINSIGAMLGYKYEWDL